MRSVLALILLVQASGTPLIRVDSRNQGRTFSVDTNRTEIRRELREVTAPSPAGPLPLWLPPFPDARPVATQGSGPPDFGYAQYSSKTSPDIVFAHYESALRAANITVTSVYRHAGRGGALHAQSSTHYAVVSVSPGAGPTDISINWHSLSEAKPALPAGARLEPVWFDDTKGILRLRDTTTKKEYDLDMSAMLSYAKSEALQTNARADFPAWMQSLPGAKVIIAAGPPANWRPTKPEDMRSFVIEMETTVPIAEILQFYKSVTAQNGLTIEQESQTPDSNFWFQARSGDRQHEFDINVLKRSRDTFIRITDSFTLPRR